MQKYKSLLILMLFQTRLTSLLYLADYSSSLHDTCQAKNIIIIIIMIKVVHLNSTYWFGEV